MASPKAAITLPSVGLMWLVFTLESDMVRSRAEAL